MNALLITQAVQQLNLILLGITPAATELLTVAEKFIWCGFAAVGFAVLFNVPLRTLFFVGLLGGLGGFTKFLMIHLGFSDVLAPFCGSAVIGLLSIPLAHYKHAPPPVFYIPALIPMIPGVLAYRMMLGMIKLVGSPLPGAEYTEILNSTVTSGLKVLFIIMGLAVGVVIPMLVTRKDSVKELKTSIWFDKRDD